MQNDDLELGPTDPNRARGAGWADLPSAGAALTDAYRRRTPASAAMAVRAQRSMPGGSTRSFGFFAPYPPTFRRGDGPRLWDLNGNEYIDLVGNGMSLIHGHAYRPIMDALRRAINVGSVWPGPSRPQVELAEVLADRLPGDNLVRFVNSGTEATMLAVKLARHVTGRPLILKAWNGYHGSADDLEAGLYGIGEIPGRAVLARFDDAESFRVALDAHPGRVAAVILESVMCTGRVQVPHPGFLQAVEEAAHDAGALFVLDDCVMFRLAAGGSAEKYGLHPDITCLGKWIGGGLPLGAIVGTADLMGVFDLGRAGALQHSGSFNGNRLSCTAGEIAVHHLTQERIDRMDEQATWLRDRLTVAAAALSVPLAVSGAGSTLGLSIVDPRTGDRDVRASADYHLASLNRGVYLGADGEIALSTSLRDEDLRHAAAGLEGALEDIAIGITCEEVG